MASSYPPPPLTTGPDSASSTIAQSSAQSVGIAQDESSPSEHLHQQPSSADVAQSTAAHHHLSLAHQHYLDSSQAAAVAAAAAAQHGLQALEAANALTSPPPMSNPVIPQFSPPTDASYLPAGANGSPISQSGVPLTAPSPNSKQPHKRLSKACDLCSQRKVKCDGQVPCRPCTDLKVQCSYDRETKRRGPPNRHAEAARKKVKIAEVGSQNAAETLMSISSQSAEGLDAEMIAPWDILVLLIDDYYTYIYPLVPFPHEPTFRVKFHQREDRKSREFLALLASMIGVLAASFPRTVRYHLKAQQSMAQFPRAVVMVAKCRDLALQARGHLFPTKPVSTVYDAATSYLLGLASGYIMDGKTCIRFFNETLTLLRELGYDKPDQVRFELAAQRSQPIDYVEVETGKRIFYVLLLGIRSLNQLDVMSTPILPLQSTSNSFPEWPTTLDDQYITSQGYGEQPAGTTPLLAGFIKAIEVYMTMQALVNIDVYYGQDLGFQEQKTIIKDVLRLVKSTMNSIPDDLKLDVDAAPTLAPPAPAGLEEQDLTYYPPSWPAPQPATDIRHKFANQPEQRRPLQFEIQKANIYSSWLATRSWYVERYFDLRDQYMNEVLRKRDLAHEKVEKAQEQADAGLVENGILSDEVGSEVKAAAEEELREAAARAREEATALDGELVLLQQSSDPTDVEMAGERELIVQDLLKVITSISQRNMEPNGSSIIGKIRAIAGTLYTKNPERKGPRAQDLDPHLLRFLDVLKALEKSGSASGGSSEQINSHMSAYDEEEELRAWACLRDEQMRFLAEGGYH
ncbi:hypothetical protein GQ53DRAFT_790523 [Thozetella sp. PMI_491]|nr:hypothetical protein GQ53DRAFT_790523 [Thozetella sp. PMI_491]